MGKKLKLNTLNHCLMITISWMHTEGVCFLQAAVCIVHNDERPVRQLRSAAYDRRC